jgi:hypothetical protein
MAYQGIDMIIDYHETYDFLNDGTVIYTIRLLDEAKFIADFVDYSMEQTYEEMRINYGMSKEQVDREFYAEMGMSLHDYCEMYALELSAMFNSTMELVYYVDGNDLYLSDAWYGEFTPMEFEITDGELIVYDAQQVFRYNYVG